MFWFTIYSALLILLDFFSKLILFRVLAYDKIIVLIPNILRLLYLKNTGAAFGIMHGNQWLLIIFSVIVSIYIIYYVNHEMPINRMQYTGLIFLFSGTVGNLINRIFMGGVIDFIDLYGRWPVFNLADIFINIGIFLIIISILRTVKK